MTTVDATFRIRALDNSGSYPSWSAAPGEIKSIATNSIYSVRQTDFTLNSVTQLYSEARSFYNPYYGQYGARVMWGGGHGGYVGNEVYICPITGPTSQWVRLTKPFNAPLVFSTPGVGWDDPSIVDKTTGEFLVAGVRGQYNGFCIPTDHTRNKTIALPGGTGGLGRMLVPCHQAYPGTGTYSWTTTHELDFGKEPYTNPTYNTSVGWWSATGDLKEAQATAAYATAGDACWPEHDLNRVGFIGWATGGTAITTRRVLYYNYNAAVGSRWTDGGAIGNYRDAVTNASAAVGIDNGMGWHAGRKVLFVQAFSGNGNIGPGIRYHYINIGGGAPFATGPLNIVGPNPPIYGASGIQNAASIEWNPIDGYWYGLFCATTRPKNDLWRLKPQDPGISWSNPNVTTAQLLAAPHVWEEITDRMPTILGYWDANRQAANVSSAALIFGYNRMQFSDALGCFTWDGGAGDPSGNTYGQVLLINPVGV